MTNPYYNETFTAALGSQARSRALDNEFERIEAAFDLLDAAVVALNIAAGRRFTLLDDCPSTLTGSGLKLVRVNAAASALEFVAGGNVTIRSVAGTGYTLVAADAGAVVLTSNSGAVTVTVPPSVFAQGDMVMVNQYGAGQVTFAEGSGVTIRSSDALLSTRKQYAQVALVCLGADEFALIGERNAETLETFGTIQMSVSDLTTSIATGTSKAYCRAPHAMTLTGIRASLLTASTSGAVTVDINVNGSTILSTKLTIDQDEKTSVTAAAAAVLSSVVIADDDEITVDIDGAGTGAKGLIVTLRGLLA